MNAIAYEKWRPRDTLDLAGLRNQMGAVFRPDPRRAARNIRSNTALTTAPGDAIDDAIDA
jgi:hypothetical protein